MNATEPAEPAPKTAELLDPTYTVAVTRPDLTQTEVVKRPAVKPKRSLATRFFLQAATLVVITLGAALLLASWQANRLSNQKIRENLASVPEIYKGTEDTQAITRRAAVRARADDAGTKALLGELGAGAETFHDSAVEFAAGLGADKVFFFDPQGRLISRSDRPIGEDAGRDFSRVRWVAEPLANLVESSASILDLKPRPKLSMVVAAPVTQGTGSEMKLNGVIAAAFPITGNDAARLGRLTGGEGLFVANTASPGGTPRIEVVASINTGSSKTGAVLPLSRPAQEALFSKGTATEPFELDLDGDAVIGTGVPIKSGSGEPIGAFVVLKSKAAELALFRRLRLGLAGVGALLLLISLPLSLVLARRISRPISQLAEAAEGIRSGRLDVQIPASSDDEVGLLARAFTQLVSDLKEKASLEALVAEMQQKVRQPSERTRGAVTFSVFGAPGSGSPSESEWGKLFAERYEILSLLGQGGMGRVYRARDRQLDDEVALKVLPGDEFKADSPAVQALKRELKMARRITHPNVVRTHDFGEFGGIFFFTMEYVAGETLKSVIGETGPLQLGPGLQIAKQICRGLAAIHEAGIAHRDLKPQNIVVMPNGVLKLMDFGIARGVGATRSHNDETEGTPLYMSPEQIRGDVVDARGDLYTAGIVFYEIFSGRLPFHAKSVEEAFQKHLGETPESLLKSRPDLPKSLADLLESCLAKDPARRPQSALELEQALVLITG